MLTVSAGYLKASRDSARLHCAEIAGGANDCMRLLGDANEIVLDTAFGDACETLVKIDKIKRNEIRKTGQ